MIIGSNTYLKERFEKVEGGWHAYKIFGSMHAPPPDWKLEPGNWLEDPGLHDNPSTLCAPGINVANDRNWIVDFLYSENLYGNFDLWRVFIPDEATIVVPFETDGKIRVNRLQLLEVIDQIHHEWDDDDDFYDDDEDDWDGEEEETDDEAQP